MACGSAGCECRLQEWPVDYSKAYKSNHCQCCGNARSSHPIFWSSNSNWLATARVKF